MKTKQFLTAALLTMCAMTTTLFTACGSDDSSNEKKEKKVPVSAALVCALYTDDETLLTFDFYVKYYDANGQVQSEKVVWDENLNKEGRRTWTKKVVAKLPATLGVKCEVKPKEGVVLDPEGEYYVGRGHFLSSALLDAAGETLSDFPGYTADYGTSRIRKEKISEVQEKGYTSLDIVYYFDANGNRTNSPWQ